MLVIAIIVSIFASMSSVTHSAHANGYFQSIRYQGTDDANQAISLDDYGQSLSGHTLYISGVFHNTSKDVQVSANADAAIDAIVKLTAHFYDSCNTEYAVTSVDLNLSEKRAFAIKASRESFGNRYPWFYSIDINDTPVVLGAPYNDSCTNSVTRVVKDAPIPTSVADITERSTKDQDYDFKSIITTASGDTVAVGAYRLTESYSDAIIARYDSVGDLVWYRDWSGDRGDAFTSVEENSDGTLTVRGYYTTYDPALLDLGTKHDLVVTYTADGEEVPLLDLTSDRIVNIIVIVLAIILGTVAVTLIVLATWYLVSKRKRQNITAENVEAPNSATRSHPSDQSSLTPPE